MPCYATGSAEGDARLSASEARSEATKAVRMLCAACRIIDRHKLRAEMPNELINWWRNHQKIDEERRKRERKERQDKIKGAALRNSAMEKLTEEEKIELFGGKP